MTVQRSSIRLSLILFGLVLLIAVGSLALAVIGESGKGNPSSSNGTVVDSAGGFAAATPLRAFTVKATDGTTIDGATLRGPAVIHIYASWCPTCRAEAKQFAAFLHANGSIKPIYVAVADKPQSAAKFVTSSGWRAGPIIDDPKRSLADKLGLTGQPNTIFVNAAGGTETVRGGAGLATLQHYANFAKS